MIAIKAGALLLLVAGTVIASENRAQNLTTYLLTKYTNEYAKFINTPTFFTQFVSGNVDAKKMGYFYEQNLIYGRGYTTLTANALINLASDLTAPANNKNLLAIDYMGESAFGISDEDSKLLLWREELLPGSSSKPLNPSPGTKAYVEYMKQVSAPGTDPFDAFVCSWAMGKAYVDIWTNIGAKQKKKNKLAAIQNAVDYWSDPAYIADVDATGEFINVYYGTEWPKNVDKIFLDTMAKHGAFWASIDSMGQT